MGIIAGAKYEVWKYVQLPVMPWSSLFHPLRGLFSANWYLTGITVMLLRQSKKFELRGYHSRSTQYRENETIIMNMIISI